MLMAALLLGLSSTLASAQFQSEHGGAPPASACGASPVSRAIELARARADGEPRMAAHGTAVGSLLDPVAGGMSSRLVTRYVDHAGADGVQDWSCGSLTTDGHRGTDVELASFADMDEGVAVIAAAGGPVIYVHDGEFDRHVFEDPLAIPNGVVVDHTDGTFGSYAHLRRGSIRVREGEWIAAGDTLGLIGSSGASGAPHLHFELDAVGALDPFAGPCLAGTSRWLSQPPYSGAQPFALLGHGITHLPGTWATVAEAPPSMTHVAPGATITSWIRTRNLRGNDVLEWRILLGANPWSTWSTFPSVTGTSGWWATTWTLPGGAGSHGSWRIEIRRNGVLIATQPFAIDGIANQLPVVPRQTFEISTTSPSQGAIVSSDGDGAVFRHEIVTPPLHGTLTFDGAYTRRWRYVPGASGFAADSARIRAVDDAGAAGLPGTLRFVVDGPLAVEAMRPDFALAAHPSPARAGSTIVFSLPRRQTVTITVADVAGRRVRTLARGVLEPGSHRLPWPGDDDAARPLPPGMVIVRLECEDGRATRRLALVR
jgi:hypothetical protein